MYERIVVPLDGSEPAERALPPAVELARRLGVPLLLARVVDTAELGDPAAGIGPRAAGGAADLAAAESAEYLEAVRRRLALRHVAVAVEVRRGAAALELVALARPANLVVMAARGRGLAGRWRLGGVAGAVADDAEAAVLLVRAGLAGG